MILKKYFTKDDIGYILREMKANLPSTKYDIGQKITSELCSKLVEQINAIYSAEKLGIKITPGKSDNHPDNVYHFKKESIPLEIKVAQTVKGDHHVRWRGGKLSKRNSDYLFIARNADCTKFFVALTFMESSDWALQKTDYYAPYFTDRMMNDKGPYKVLWGSVGKDNKKNFILNLEDI